MAGGLVKMEIYISHFSHDLIRLRDLRLIWLFGWWPITYNLIKFTSHKLRSCKDILFFHFSSNFPWPKGYVTLWINPWPEVTTMSSLVHISIAVMKIYFSFFYAKSRYDLSKESFDFVVDGRLSKITFMSSTSWSTFLNLSLDLTWPMIKVSQYYLGSGRLL